MHDIETRLRTLLEMNKPTLGIDEARAAIAANPEWAYGYGYLAYFLYDQQYFPEARDAVRTAIAKDPCNAWFYVIFASIQDRLGRHKERDAALREAISLNPDRTDARAMLSQSLYSAGRYYAARNIALDGIQRVPDNVELLEALAWAELGVKNFNVAVDSIERALALNPEKATVWHTLSVILTNRNRPGDIDRAGRAIDEAIRIDPCNVRYRMIRNEMQ